MLLEPLPLFFLSFGNQSVVKRHRRENQALGLVMRVTPHMFKSCKDWRQALWHLTLRDSVLAPPFQVIHNSFVFMPDVDSQTGTGKGLPDTRRHMDRAV